MKGRSEPVSRRLVVLLFGVNLVLFGCTQWQAFVHQPSTGNQVFGSARPQNLSDSIRSVIRSSTKNFGGVRAGFGAFR